MAPDVSLIEASQGPMTVSDQLVEPLHACTVAHTAKLEVDRPPPQVPGPQSSVTMAKPVVVSGCL
jgi:hypothetical protein